MFILYVIVILFLILLLISKLILNMVFGKRCEGNPKLKYFTADDFEGLEILRPIEFKSNKGKIPEEESDKIYNNIDYKKITEEDKKVMNMIIKFLQEAI